MLGRRYALLLLAVTFLSLIFTPLTYSRYVCKMDNAPSKVISATSSSIKVFVKFPNDAPAAGARVYLDGKYLGTTDAEGQFTISNVAAGTYTIEAVADAIVETVGGTRVTKRDLYSKSAIVSILPPPPSPPDVPPPPPPKTIDVELVLWPIRCLEITHASISPNEVRPGDSVTVTVRWIFYICCPCCRVKANAYGSWDTSKQLAVVFDGGDCGLQHKEMEWKYTFTMPEVPVGDYHIRVGFPYDFYFYSYEKLLGVEHVDIPLRVSAPRYRVRVRVEGLPIRYAVYVKIDGQVAGSLRGGEEKVFVAAKTPVMVEVPATVYDGRTRFIAEKTVQTAGADSLTVFRYYAEHQVEIDTSPRLDWVEVNGTRVNLPYSRWIREGTILNVTAQSLIPIESTPTMRKAYIFSKWSDDVTSFSRSIFVDKPINLTALYVLSVEYVVKLTANFREAESGLKGAGWYREGMKITISAEPLITVSDDVRLVFVEWTGLSSRSTVNILVDSPKELKAIYKRQYRLIVTGFRGTILDGWYYEGDQVTVTLPDIEDGCIHEMGGKVRYRFIRWIVEKGNLSSTSNPEVNFSVTSPVRLRAEFSEPEFQVIIEGTYTGYTSRYYPRHSTLGSLPDNPIIPLLVVDRFVEFEDAETGRSLGRSVTIDRPLRLVAKYQRDYSGLIVFIALSVVAGAGFFAYKGGWLTRRAGATEADTCAATTDEKEATAVVSVEELKHELEIVEEKVKEHREYLNKLEYMHKKGEVTNDVYKELKDFYSKELEKYEEELKTIKEKMNKIKETSTISRAKLDKG